MSAVLKCDGCGAIVAHDEDAPIGWLQIRRYQEPSNDFPYGRSNSFEVVGHCCSLGCLGALALAQNDPEEAPA